jgi:FKBP-type peptidyl-prolyl cis-trans isomerase
MNHAKHIRWTIRRFIQRVAGQSPRALAPIAALILAAAVLVAACAEPEVVTRPVTDEMRAEAMQSVRRREMPAWSDWRFEETERGVRYVELTPGTGRIPDWGNEVRLHYNLWLTDGTLVDSSRDTGTQPFSFTVGEGRVVAGWENVVRRLRVGGTYLVVVPSELGYGRRGSRTVPGNATLVFSMELVGIR